ncbi:MAG: helix-turn-helix transcriptional regulator [Lachnospiraceae bacterium]|nr:helix-turn-helix transcriptional regulator [Lachnospiraceae bacterium]
MMINDIIKQQHLSKYRLAKNSGIPYMTINDICGGRTNPADCSAKTIYKLSKVLGVSMEALVEPYIQPRPAFELFKSNVCHRLKELGDIDFLIDTIEGGEIVTYYNRSWYPECLYLLAMVDYISRENDVPLCEEYNSYRSLKLDDIIFPSGVLMADAAAQSDDAKEAALRNAIPEFKRFNIVENEVRDVI